jgi:hypothetical protein
VAAAVVAVDSSVPNGNGHCSGTCASMRWASPDMLHAGVHALLLVHSSMSTARLCPAVVIIAAHCTMPCTCCSPGHASVCHAMLCPAMTFEDVVAYPGCALTTWCSQGS